MVMSPDTKDRRLLDRSELHTKCTNVLSVCLSLCLCVSVCLSVCLSVYLSLCLCVCVCLYLFLCLSLCFALSVVCLSVCLSVCLFPSPSLTHAYIHTHLPTATHTSPPLFPSTHSYPAYALGVMIKILTLSPSLSKSWPYWFLSPPPKGLW